MKRSFAIVALLFLPVAFSVAQQRHIPDKAKREPMQAPFKISGSLNYQILNINNITTWLRSDGQSNHSPSGDNGAWFPRGTRWVIYQDGIVWGAKTFLDPNYSSPAPDQVIRVGGQTYDVGTRAGRIIGEGSTAMPADTSSPAVRLYRIRRDYAEQTDYELRREAAEYFETSFSAVTEVQINQIFAQYDRDWQEWPVHYGAPYIERNGIDGYQPPPGLNSTFTSRDLVAGDHDEPGIAGSEPDFPADQVLWTVFNDLDDRATPRSFGSEPLGFEVQVTVWGYKRNDAMGNIYFKRVKLINKGGVDVGAGVKGSFWLDSLFVAQWSDPDIGIFTDDLVGCDTLLNMAFAYNSNDADAEFRKFNLPPPAIGYDLLQGPTIPGAPTDSAIFDLKRIYGKKNLAMTSFAYQPADPLLELSPREIELRFWRMLQGFYPDFSLMPWRLYPHPPGMTPTKYPLSGDPVTQTGFIDGLGTAYSFTPGDRRFLMSSGPFPLAPGETQELLIATVAGLGADYLSSITAMKFNDRAAKQAFRGLFDAARPPASLKVQAIELDREIILDWGADVQQVQDTEGKIVSADYAFEGYNVYQFPSSTAQLSEGVQIATFDMANDVRWIVDEVVDPLTGLVIPTVLQRGNNEGIQRSLRITRDLSQDPYGSIRLNNGQEYYFAVTAYNYSRHPHAFPKSLESDVQILRAKPRIPFGVRLHSNYGDTLQVRHTQGRSDGAVYPIVINPTAGIGDSYEVRFDTSRGLTTWYLRNTSRDSIVISGQTNQRGDDAYNMVQGGLLLKVVGPPPGLIRENMGWEWVSGNRFLTWAGGADGLGFEAFNGAAGWDSPQRRFGNGTMQVKADQLKAVQIRFAPTSDNFGTFDPAHPNASYAYRYGRGFDSTPAQPAFVPFMVNAASGFSYQDYTIGMPLAVYDIDANPPRRLAVGFLENNVAGGSVNGRYWPPFYSDADNVSPSGPSEWLFIFASEYTGSAPDPARQKEMIGNPLPVMYWATWSRRNTNPWPPDNILALYPTRANGVRDVFSYAAPAPETGLDVQKASAQTVGVFPNPYYAGHSQEKTSWRRFVTFNNLPPKAKIRIFNLGGQLVRTLKKDDPSQFLEWDLTNERNWQVGSGMYICHVEMPELNETKVLKLAVIQPQLFPGNQ